MGNNYTYIINYVYGIIFGHVAMEAKIKHINILHVKNKTMYVFTMYFKKLIFQRLNIFSYFRPICRILEGVLIYFIIDFKYRGLGTQPPAAVAYFTKENHLVYNLKISKFSTISYFSLLACLL